MKLKYWDIKKILEKNAQYNLIIGERSNGKTYGCLKYALENYVKNGKQVAIVRRWQDDFKGKRGATMFDALVNNGVVKELTDGEWTNVYSYSGRWYLCRYEDDKMIKQEFPFAYGFAISSQEHDKSSSYPNISTIIFDEFLTRGTYLPDEFVLFMNVLSTIIRERKDVKIFMLGNTVNQYSPYFNEMGLYKVKEMKPGNIDLYTYGDSKLKVAIEYCGESTKQKKDSDIYFAFNNPKLQMITEGSWEIDIYPHLPIKYAPKDIMFKYFIQFDSDLLQCEVIFKEDSMFTYIHRKTTPLKDEENDLIFTTRWSERPNIRRKINKPIDELGRKIYKMFQDEKVFYQDNQIGEIIRNYIIWCNGK